MRHGLPLPDAVVYESGFIYVVYDAGSGKITKVTAIVIVQSPRKSIELWFESQSQEVGKRQDRHSDVELRVVLNSSLLKIF